MEVVTYPTGSEKAENELRSFLRTRKPPRTTFIRSDLYPTIQVGHFANLKGEVYFSEGGGQSYYFEGKFVQAARVWQSRIDNRDGAEECYHQIILELMIEGVWKDVRDLV